MLNLTSKKTLDAKMRVKSDIFAGWEEEIDHQVRTFYLYICIHVCVCPWV
jgi:hypothetical protein